MFDYFGSLVGGPLKDLKRERVKTIYNNNVYVKWGNFEYHVSKNSIFLALEIIGIDLYSVELMGT